MQCLLQQAVRIKSAEPAAAAKIRLGVGSQDMPGVLDSNTMADRSESVFQQTPLAGVHMDSATGDQGQVKLLSQCGQDLQPLSVVPVQSPAYSKPGASLEVNPNPGRGMLRSSCVATLGVYPQQQAVAPAADQVIQLQPVAALGGLAARVADQLGQVAVAGPVGGQQYQPQLVGEPELAAENQRQTCLPGGQKGTHGPGQRAFIGKRESPVAQFCGLSDQLFGMRGAAQKTEIADAIQFGIVDGKAVSHINLLL